MRTSACSQCSVRSRSLTACISHRSRERSQQPSAGSLSLSSLCRSRLFYWISLCQVALRKQGWNATTQPKWTMMYAIAPVDSCTLFWRQKPVLGIIICGFYVLYFSSAQIFASIRTEEGHIRSKYIFLCTTSSHSLFHF